MPAYNGPTVHVSIGFYSGRPSAPTLWFHRCRNWGSGSWSRVPKVIQPGSTEPRRLLSLLASCSVPSTMLTHVPCCSDRGSRGCKNPEENVCLRSRLESCKSQGWLCAQVNVHTCERTYTPAHTCTHTCTHMHIRARVRTCTRTHIHARTHVYTCMHAHTRARTYARTRARTCTRTHAPLCGRARTGTLLRT